MAKNTLDLLLAIDKSKIERPKKKLQLNRLTELAGEPVVFTCQALTMEEQEEIQDMAISFGKRGELEDFSAKAVQIFTLLKGVVDPELKNAKLLEAYGAKTPKELLEQSKFLLPGEVTQLYNVISELSGFGGSSVEELKNG